MPDELMIEPQHAMYSAKAEKLFGAAVYLTPDGRLVKLIGFLPRSQFKWDDAVDCGVWTKDWIFRGRTPPLWPRTYDTDAARLMTLIESMSKYLLGCHIAPK